MVYVFLSTLASFKTLEERAGFSPVGVPVPIIGSVVGDFVGAFVGAALFEYTRRGTRRPRAGRGGVRSLAAGPLGRGGREDGGGGGDGGWSRVYGAASLRL